MLNKAQTKTKPVLIIGGYGSGKTTMAIKLMGQRPHMIMPASDITIEDIYSYPKHHGVIIEDVNYKPDKDKVLNLLLTNENVIMTSINEKDVAKFILNVCSKKKLGRVDSRQKKIKELAPNSDVIVNMDKSIYELTEEIVKNKDRVKVLKMLKFVKPSDMHIISWVQPNVGVNVITPLDNIMRKWSIDYFYELLAYSLSGSNSGRINFPTRNAYSPVPKICYKLNLKTKESYLVKSFLQEDKYKLWAANRLDNDECKILNIKKVKKLRISVTKQTRKLSDF